MQPDFYQSADEQGRITMKRHSTIAAALGAILSAAAIPAEAQSSPLPYQFVAKYHSADKKLEAVVGTNAVVPRSATGYTFDGIFLRFKGDATTNAQLSDLRNVTVGVKYCKDPDCGVALAGTRPLSIERPKPGSETLVLSPDALPGTRDEVDTIAFDVHLKFSSQYLCAQELVQRQLHGHDIAKLLPTAAPEVTAEPANGKAKPAPKPENSKDPAKPKRADLLGTDALPYGVLVEHGLTVRDVDPKNSWAEPIVYSFCEEVQHAVRYQALAEASKQAVGQPAEGSEKKEAEEKDKLGRYMQDKLSVNAAYGTIVYEADAPGIRQKNVYALTVQKFALAKEPELELKLTEDGEAFQYHVIAQSSQILLKVSKDFCVQSPGCDSFVRDHLVAYADYKDKTGNPIHAKLDLVRSNQDWALKIDLRAHLNDTITFNVYQKLADVEIPVASSGPLTVRDIGVVWSFPVVSDVMSAVSAPPASPSDLKIQSSIPLSYAVPFRGAVPTSNLAVTLPFMIGFNTHSASQLADVVRVYPHVSFIFPLKNEANGKTRVAYGAGVSLLKAFDFSVAYSVGDDPQPYLLMGVSLTDIPKLNGGD